jgi:hypothetical protein
MSFGSLAPRATSEAMLLGVAAMTTATAPLSEVFQFASHKMPIKKSQLYSSIWQGCDELRGGMDASQYKDYVLILLFVRYVSDKYAGQK